MTASATVRDAFDTFRCIAESLRREDRGTISMRLLREALFDITRLHGQPAEILHRTGLSVADLDDDERRIPVEQYAAVWLATVEATGDEFFCMNRRAMRSGSLSFVTRATLERDSLREAVHLALNFFSLTFDGMTGRLVEEEDVAYIALQDSEPHRRAFTYFTFWLLLHGLMCFLIRQRIRIVSIDLVSHISEYCSDYRVLFTDDLRFSQERNRLVIARHVLDYPVRATRSDRRMFLRHAPANILVRYRNDTGTVARVKHLLRSRRPDDWPDFDEIAQTFNQSSSTLRRRIEAEGHSFQHIKDSVRMEMAVHLLRTTTVSLTQVAESIGFSETSSFFRAFRKWTGENPGAFRSRPTSSRPAVCLNTA